MICQAHRRQDAGSSSCLQAARNYLKVLVSFALLLSQYAASCPYMHQAEGLTVRWFYVHTTPAAMVPLLAYP